MTAGPPKPPHTHPRTVPHSNAPSTATPLHGLHGLHGTFPGAPVIGTPVPEHPAHPVKHRPSHRGVSAEAFLALNVATSPLGSG